MNQNLKLALLLVVGLALGVSLGKHAGLKESEAKAKAQSQAAFDNGRASGCETMLLIEHPDLAVMNMALTCKVKDGDLYVVGKAVRNGEANADKAAASLREKIAAFQAANPQATQQ